MIYLMKDMIYLWLQKNFNQQMIWLVKPYLKRNLRNAYRKLLAGSKPICWEEPTTSREVSASNRVSNTKEITRREESNTLNDKEVCKVSSDI